jgi:hypothetical protein
MRSVTGITDLDRQMNNRLLRDDRHTAPDGGGSLCHRHSGAPQSGESGIQTHRQVDGFRTPRYPPFRNDDRVNLAVTGGFR